MVNLYRRPSALVVCRSVFQGVLVSSLLAFLPGVGGAATEAGVRSACEKIWVHGITKESAESEIGADGVPFLLRLLADDEFQHRDNVVFFLSFLGGDDAAGGLVEFLREPPSTNEIPEEDRALLYSPIALGHLAAGGSPLALRSLFEMTDENSGGGELLRSASRSAQRPDSLRDDLLEMAIHGLAISGDARALRRVKAIADQRHALGQSTRRFDGTARNALENRVGPARTRSTGSPPPTPHSPSSGTMASVSPAASAPLDATASKAAEPANTRSLFPHSTVTRHLLSYANHANLGANLAVSNDRVESILARSDLMVGRADYPADVACCNVFGNAAPPVTFGSAGDGKDIIDSENELDDVLNDPAARVKVVRAILYCGGPSNSTVGCGWRGGWGIAVVRYASVTYEASLLMHEYGHNLGLTHSEYDSSLIMYPYINPGGGLDEQQCGVFHSPSPSAATNREEVGVCIDADSDDVHDFIDNCPIMANNSQTDTNGNGIGNACDCGDGLVSYPGGESCEDGNTIDGDGCDSNCTITACGNGIVTTGEQCDDANSLTGDGCLPNCTIEYCGDGVLNNNGETCEDGNTVSGDGCSSDCRDEDLLCGGDGCTMFSTSTTTQGAMGGFNGADAICAARAAVAGLPGRYIAWLGSRDYQGTSARGRLAPASGPFVRTCGGSIATDLDDLLDGSISNPIQCDENGNSVSATGVWTGTAADGEPNYSCSDWTTTAGQGASGDESASGPAWTQLGDASGLRSCSDPRRLYCVEQENPPTCGNGILEQGEICDDGNIVNGDGCNDSCSDCGDGIVGPTEACDDGDATEGDGCDTNCTLSACGNGIVAPTETCDDGGTVSNDGCSADCHVEYCGDGILNDNGETCEDGNTVSGDGCSSTCQDERHLCGGDGCTMFVTSTTQQGNLGGFAGADAICNARAQVAGLAGSFVAWLGAQNGQGTPAASRLDPATGPLVRTCGGTIATNIADLLDGYQPGGGLALPIQCNEFGATVSPVGVWTGTSPDGPPLASCDEWRTTAGQGGSGDESATNSTWTMLGDGNGVRNCSDPRRLYCIEQYHDPVHGDGILQIGEECDDGNLVAGDCCAPDGTVEAGGASCASDGNPCTDDVCDGAGRCGAYNTAGCDDGLFCNGNDMCLGGACQVHAGSPCTGGGGCAGDCNESLDACMPLAGGTPCADYGNECVDAVCDGAGNCGVNNAAPCDDGLFCNGADTCASGTCSQHAGDPCTGGTACANACNEAADSCILAAGQPCTDDGNVCTDDECDGAGACVHPTNTASCDDDNQCTVGDICSGGTCVAGGSSLTCNDNDGCTRDSCDAALGCQNVEAPLPATACLVAPRTQLLLKASSDPSRSSLKWKWGNGAAIDQAAFGTPDVDTAYAFCLFDTSASSPTLKAHLEIAPGSLWTSNAPKGWSYADKAGTADGVAKLALKTGDAGRTKAQLQAKGSHLSMPVPFSGTQYFEQDPEVVAQLVGSNGLCLTSVFPEATRNDGANFKAKTKVAPSATDAFSHAGPFPVGGRTEVFVDSSRPTMANGAYPGAASRTLTTKIWYPAQSEGAATPAAAGGPFPVVLLAHGFTSQRLEHALLGRHLASHGFIAVAPDFPLSNRNAPGGATASDLVSQAGDVTFVLGATVALGASPADGLNGKVDGTSRAVVGHSLGGMTATVAGYDHLLADPDLDAVVLLGHLSCHQLAGYYAAGPPLLVVGGTGDAVVPFVQHAAQAYSRAPAPKRLVTLVGGTHVGFMDASIGLSAGSLDEQFCAPISNTYFGGARPFPQQPVAGFPQSDPNIDYAGCTMCNPLGSGLMEADRQHDLTGAAVLAFLSAELAGDTGAETFLDLAFPSENADVEVVVTP